MRRAVDAGAWVGILLVAPFACVSSSPGGAGGAPEDAAVAPTDASTTTSLDEAAARGWSIDSELKLQLAYLPPSPSWLTTPECIERPASLGLAPEFRPDVSNIVLSAALDLGLPLPRREHADQQTVFLKLFQAPTAVELGAIARRLLDEFLVFAIEAKAPALEALVSRPERLAVKVAHVAASTEAWTAAHPFPPFELDRCACDRARSFLRSVPFFSLYVMPGSFWPSITATDDERAATSRQGVVAFHAQLTRVYEKRLHEIVGAEPARYRFFVPADWQCTTMAPHCSLTVWRLPRLPLALDHWRELPMPQDPQRTFLTALLLVHRYEYPVDGRVLAPSGGVDAIDFGTFARAAVPSSVRVFEVGSVVRLR